MLENFYRNSTKAPSIPDIISMINYPGLEINGWVCNVKLPPNFVGPYLFQAPGESDLAPGQRLAVRQTRGSRTVRSCVRRTDISSARVRGAATSPATGTRAGTSFAN